MLQQLATETSATGWAIASMLFFLGVWIFVAVRVARSRPEDLAARANLPLADDGEAPRTLSTGVTPAA